MFFFLFPLMQVVSTNTTRVDRQGVSKLVCLVESESALSRATEKERACGRWDRTLCNMGIIQ